MRTGAGTPLVDDVAGGLLDLWRELFGGPDVGLDDDFFEAEVTRCWRFAW